MSALINRRSIPLKTSVTLKKRVTSSSNTHSGECSFPIPAASSLVTESFRMLRGPMYSHHSTDNLTVLVVNLRTDSA
jgi:hypothetical protein